MCRLNTFCFVPGDCSHGLCIWAELQSKAGWASVIMELNETLQPKGDSICFFRFDVPPKISLTALLPFQLLVLWYS